MEKHEDKARWEQLRKPRHWTAEDARWVIAAWRASGKPMGAFAFEMQLDPERLRRWRSRLEGALRRPRPAPARPAVPARPTALIPVAVRASAPVVLGDSGAVVVSTGRVQIAIRDLGATSPDWVARLVGRLAAEAAS